MTGIELFKIPFCEGYCYLICQIGPLEHCGVSLIVPVFMLFSVFCSHLVV